MKENLEKNNEVFKDISYNSNKSNSQEIKKPTSEKTTIMNENNAQSQNNSAPKVDV